MSHLVPLTLALWMLADPPAEGGRDRGAEPPSALAVAVAVEEAVAGAIARAEPSVVAIARIKSEDGETTAVVGRNPAPPIPPARDARGALLPNDPSAPGFFSLDYGSGVVVGDRGQILTAFHVVRGAARLWVRAAGGVGFEAEVLAADPRSDLAVIVPREDGGGAAPRLAALPLGDATRLRKGAFLVALGNPFNAARDGRPSASWGILSNVARKVEPGDEMVRQLRHLPTLLQLDAKLNQGMSGGAVVDLRGELVGLTTTAGNPSGFDAQAGYAIPMDALGRRAVEALAHGREVEYGFLGVRLQAHKTNQIESVLPLTPADEGGLLTDDTIVSVNGRPTPDGDGLILAVNAAQVGEPIRLAIERPGHGTVEKTVILSKMPVEGAIVTNRPDPWRGLRVDFTSTLAQNAADFALLETMARGGVAVVGVEPGSPAEAAGLRPGQVITHVQDKPVRTPAEFARIVAGRSGPVTLTTDRAQVLTVK